VKGARRKEQGERGKEQGERSKVKGARRKGQRNKEKGARSKEQGERGKEKGARRKVKVHKVCKVMTNTEHRTKKQKNNLCASLCFLCVSPCKVRVSVGARASSFDL